MENQLESDIAARPAPKVSPADIDAQVKGVQYHVFAGSQLTVCCVTMQNDFTVTGESACADPRNFDESIGQRVALAKAKDKIWPLLGYVLREKLHAA